MISKAKIKYIKSLQVKKYRKQEQCFVVEGAKSVEELLSSGFEVTWLAATEEFARTHERRIRESRAELVLATTDELSAAGSFQTNDACVALARMKPNEPFSLPPGQLALALDDIRDPGNLGTMIRTADWYGVKHMVASEETADFYNAKVIAATMGSFGRVHVYYTSLPQFLKSSGAHVYGTFLQGADVHKTDFTTGGFIVIGNESNGISREVESSVTSRITIPRYGNAESLNAAIATGIVLDAARASKK